MAADPLFRKLVQRLIVPLAVLSFVNAIDRMNISFAGQAMSADLGLTPATFGLGISAFFLAYLLFQYPHALLLRLIGLRWWLLLSVTVWGIAGVLAALIADICILIWLCMSSDTNGASALELTPAH